MKPTEPGEAILRNATQAAFQQWGPRLVAVYALGSLAHGGFSPLVSDVDMALVLSDLQPSDAAAIEALNQNIRQSPDPLAQRLSVFWGSLDSLQGHAEGGRFPPLDRLDLKQFGRLLYGKDIRSSLSTPTQRELVVAGASFALQKLLNQGLEAQVQNPALLLAAGVRDLTKTVLFPVRFVYTAQTGQVGTNPGAVSHLQAQQAGPGVALAQAALHWRSQAPDPHDPQVLELLQNGLGLLYRQFVAEYQKHLEGYGELELARQLRRWGDRI